MWQFFRTSDHTVTISKEMFLQFAAMVLAFSRRNKIILVCLFLFSLVGPGFIFWHGKNYRPVISGDVSEADRSAILRLVRSDLWQQGFPPDLSWGTIRMTPKYFYCIATARILEIRAPRFPELGFEVKGNFGWNSAGDYYWFVRKLPIGWTINSAGPRGLGIRNAIKRQAFERELSSQMSQEGRKVVPPIFVTPSSNAIEQLPGVIDGGATFSRWISNYACLTLEDRTYERYRSAKANEERERFNAPIRTRRP